MSLPHLQSVHQYSAIQARSSLNIADTIGTIKAVLTFFFTPITKEKKKLKTEAKKKRQKKNQNRTDSQKKEV